MKKVFQQGFLVGVVLSLKNTRYAIGQYKVSEEVKAEREPKDIKNPKYVEFTPQKKKSSSIYRFSNGLTKM